MGSTWVTGSGFIAAMTLAWFAINWFYVRVFSGLLVGSMLCVREGVWFGERVWDMDCASKQECYLYGMCIQATMFWGKTSVVSSRKPSNEFTSFLSEHLRATGFIQDCHPEVSDMLIYWTWIPWDFIAMDWKEWRFCFSFRNVVCSLGSLSWCKWMSWRTSSHKNNYHILCLWIPMYLHNKTHELCIQI